MEDVLRRPGGLEAQADGRLRDVDGRHRGDGGAGGAHGGLLEERAAGRGLLVRGDVDRLLRHGGSSGEGEGEKTSFVRDPPRQPSNGYLPGPSRGLFHPRSRADRRRGVDAARKAVRRRSASRGVSRAGLPPPRQSGNATLTPIIEVGSSQPTSRPNDSERVSSPKPNAAWSRTRVVVVEDDPRPDEPLGVHAAGRGSEAARRSARRSGPGRAGTSPPKRTPSVTCRASGVSAASVSCSSPGSGSTSQSAPRPRAARAAAAGRGSGERGEGGGGEERAERSHGGLRVRACPRAYAGSRGRAAPPVRVAPLRTRERVLARRPGRQHLLLELEVLAVVLGVDDVDRLLRHAERACTSSMNARASRRFCSFVRPRRMSAFTNAIAPSRLLRAPEDEVVLSRGSAR